MVISQNLIDGLPSEYLRLYKGRDYYLSCIEGTYARDRIEHLDDRTNCIGGMTLPFWELEKAKRLLPSEIISWIERNSIRSPNGFETRGWNYYIKSGVSYESRSENTWRKLDQAKVKDAVISGIKENLSALKIVGDENCGKGLSEMIPIVSLLDYQRHYLLGIFKAFFRELFLGKIFDRLLYDKLEEATGKAIASLYTFIVKGELNPDIGDISVLESCVEKCDFRPTDWWRELDDIAKITLFGINVSTRVESPLEVVVNPYSGAVELGFALDAVTSGIGKNIVEDIILLKYSTYEAGDNFDEVQEGESLFWSFAEVAIPEILKAQAYQRLAGKVAFILDDNVTTLRTLRDIRKALVDSGLCRSALLGAVELGRIDRRGRFSPEILKELDFEPVGDRMSKGRKIELILRQLTGK
jgi:hypothetical protein